MSFKFKLLIAASFGLSAVPAAAQEAAVEAGAKAEAPAEAAAEAPAPSAEASVPGAEAPAASADQANPAAEADSAATADTGTGADAAGQGGPDAGEIVAATAADVRAGVSVLDPQGGVVGTVESVDAEGAVVSTGSVRARMPISSFGRNDRGLVISMTRSELEAAAAARNPS